ncbi:diguanylate cyclase [Paraburkholderia sp. DHOC27]|uniref:GGDEF domain-containing protein n=1 Tax=Paraburkholderia sp. DHOC27 TaxID=2303330 RepID=UPI000E3BA6C3|nr:GGDEF domain-containing protein [Paraburkholderia sp. DHOC27]RFU48594.1 GGDEF domain-containing protein [Paraburkholderia sp. DHOC27]
MGWFDKDVWHGPTVIGIYETQPEKEQAVFRTILGSLALLAYAIVAVPHLNAARINTMLVMAVYVAYGALTWLTVRVHPRTSLPRLMLTTILDQCLVFTALALGGRAALPLLFIVFWFLVGAGCRYGKRPLILSCAISVAGLTGLMIWQPWWQHNYPAGAALLLAVVASSLYLFVFVNKLERRAATDPLTGLLNRASLERTVGQTQPLAKPANSTDALFVIDLDGFKKVNDSFGHSAGDDLLQQFAQALLALSRRGDAVARLGGDEFVVFARQVAGHTGATAIAERIHVATESIRFAAGNPVNVSASIGVYLRAEAARTQKLDVTRAFRLADYAMYSAKARGPRQTVFADEWAQMESA